MCTAQEQNSIKTLTGLFFQAIYEAMGDTFTPEALLNGLTGATAIAHSIVAQVEKSNSDPKIACKAGCCHCCHSQVKVTPPEAFLIVMFITKNPQIADHLGLTARIRNNQQLTRGKSLEARVPFLDRTPCIFLDHGQCAIYPVRPLICRAWVSFSSQACEKAFLSRDFGAEIETSSVRNQVFSLAREAMQAVCKNRGLSTNAIELPEAMECCFQTTNRFHEWIRGRDIFQETVLSHGSSTDTEGAGSLSTVSPFMMTHIPDFLQRFSLSYFREVSCIEYYLKTKGKEDPISRSLTLSHDVFAKSLCVSKFYPEIYKEDAPKYHSAVCFYLILHHAAQQFHLYGNSRIQLETRVQVFDSFYSRLLDFDFSVQHRRGLDNYGIQGKFHGETVDTTMITMTDSLSHDMS
ncbi:MAG: YkgJ family cysteine cluster protein [Pseudomonadota bacterium]